MEITIGTKNQIYKTIGHNENYQPVLFYKIGQRKQAIQDLTDFYNQFHKVLETTIQFTEEEHEKFGKQFESIAYAKAMETIERIEENETMYKDRFFTHLR